jgi:hypothetical protein
MEDLAHNAKANREAQRHRKYDMFPFTEIGAILQNILYQLVRKDDPLTNQLLAESNFGFVFGEQMILEYEFIRHCIDNKIESMVLIDTYVKKNEIRLNTFEALLRNGEHTLKSQFIKSNFFERLFADYIADFKEFNIQFSKIDLEFLAFRKTFPIRLEAISILNCTLQQKERAPAVFTELIMYARRHFLIRNEVALLRQGGRGMSNQEATALLLLSIILESNEEDLIYAMMQESAHKVVREMMKEFPSLNKRYPVLAAFTNKF